MSGEFALLVILERTIRALIKRGSTLESAPRVVLRFHVVEDIVRTAHFQRTEVALVHVIAHVRRFQMVLHNEGRLGLETAKFALLHFQVEGLVVLFAQLQVLDQRVDVLLRLGRCLPGLALLALGGLQQVRLHVLSYQVESDGHEKFPYWLIEVRATVF